MNLYLLIKVYCNNDYLDSRPYYAVVEVNEEFVGRMLADVQRVKDFKARVDDQIYLFEFWDYSPEWIADLGDWENHGSAVDLLSNSSDLMTAVNDDGVALLAEKPPIDQDDADNRTECGTRIVTVDGIKWQAIPKHTNDYMDTATIGLETWKKIKTILRKERNQS